MFDVLKLLYQFLNGELELVIKPMPNSDNPTHAVIRFEKVR